MLAPLGACRPNLEHNPLPFRQVHQFSFPTHLQDLSIAANGDIFVTTVWPNASIYHLSDTTSAAGATASLVHTFDDLNATTGIIELEDGVFAFLGGSQTQLGFGILGTFSVYKLDLRPSGHSKGDELELRSSGDERISKIVHIPEAGLIVGVEKTPASDTTILIADSTLGGVWRLDTVSRKYEMVIKHHTMHAPDWAAIPFGISSLHIHKGYLYWNNAFISTIYRVGITDDGYLAEGAVFEEVVTLRTMYLDNFNFGGRNGGDTIWAATNADNRVIAITPDGRTTVVVGEPNQLTVAGAVGGQFGRLDGDSDTLYVVTGGALVVPVNGTFSEGGKVVAIDTTSFFT